MNHTFHSVWNAALGCHVATPETARCHRGSSTSGGLRLLRITSLAAALGLAGLSSAQSLPTGGNVSAGNASFDQSAQQLVITQHTSKLATDWQSFNIGTGHTVQFVQPSASAIALNRVIGPDASSIQGNLISNGQVFLLNPNGILFTPTAQVHVGGLVASTLGLGDDDFLAGKYNFSGASTQSIVNQGHISAQQGGFVAVIAARIVNDGQIHTPGGNTLLGAGQRVTLDIGGPVQLQVDQGALDAQIANGGAIVADGGRIFLTAKAAGELGNAVINQAGVLEASRLSATDDGRIVLQADGGAIVQTGQILANGRNGADAGVIQVRADAVVDAGTWSASAQAGGNGGQIDIATTRSHEQTAASMLAANGDRGGSVRVTSDGAAWFSGGISANGAAATGGEVAVTAQDLVVAGATLRADGAKGGGRARVGGGWQGNDSDLTNAASTTVTTSTLISADAVQSGNGGSVVIWSQEGTGAAGQISARGGAGSGNGGQVEVSSKGLLAFGAQVDVTAANGQAGRVLLDPKNIVIDNSTPPSYTVTPLTYVNPKAGDSHGSGGVVQLTGGNIVVSSPGDDTVATDAGAVRLYKPDGTLLATLTGSTASDVVGNGGVQALSTGNYTVSSSNWDNGSIVNAGAVTFGNGTSGVSGIVSASNSLVGSTTSDSVGGTGITVLSNGNYLVRSAVWDNGAASNAGAVTFGSGMTGVAGAVSASNSLVGNSNNDAVGSAAPTLLSNGNYVVLTSAWDNGSIADAGAVTWGNGTSGVSGVVSAANSLVGSTANDLNNASVIALSNGNYVVRSYNWDNGSVVNAGAVTWGNGTSGVSGAISVANSLVGTTANDQVGSSVTALTNGNYIVGSMYWDNGAIQNAGASTFGNGTTGISGTISTANSLVGTAANDNVSGAVTELKNGNYVLTHSFLSVGGVSYAGAVTWGSGTSGVKGTISAANSLVGGSANDVIGYDGIVALSNGNYLVKSSKWANGGYTNAGAITFGNGATGISGVVGTGNSLVGSYTDEQLGMWGITLLTNGNYVVNNYEWSNGGALYRAGASTFGSGTTGVKGVVSASNSLVGTQSGDTVGTAYALSNGNYVVASPGWNGSMGAVTFANGTTGITGTISAANSLLGSTAYDRVGQQIKALANGNYVVISSDWSNGAATRAGAVTFGNGTTGVKGTVSAANSLVGSTAFDMLGYGDITVLASGNYLIVSPYWNNGAASQAGAVTFASGITGIIGTISEANSLIGDKTGDNVGASGISLLTNGNYLVRSAAWDSASAANVGALTFGNGTTGVTGVVSAANSLVGSTTNDMTMQVTALSNGNYVVTNYMWDNGSVVDAGAVTFGSGTTGVSGVISAANSLVGSSANDRVGFHGVTEISNGNYVVSSRTWDNGGFADAGALSIGNGTSGVKGTISTANSLMGTSANEQFGINGFVKLSDGRFIARSASSAGNTGRIEIIDFNGAALGSTLAYGTAASQSSTVSVSQILALLETGAAVTLQANNDITLANALNVNNASGDGGALTLQAGRSILLNAGITTDNGNLTLIANDRASNGVVDAHRDAGVAAITMATGTTIDAGTGTVSIQMRDGQGVTNAQAGSITLANVHAGNLSIDSVALNASLTALGKVYDGGVAAQGTATLTSGLAFAAGSNLSLATSTASFDDRSAGDNRTVTSSALQVTGFGGSANLLNAGSTLRPTTTADITRRTLNVAASAYDKVYDGLKDATVDFSDDHVSGDQVVVIGASRFDDKNVGTNKVVNVTGLTLAGDDASNYQLASTSVSTTADITARTLHVTATAQNKVYDGLKAATVSFGDDRVTDDVITISGSSNFDTKDVATGKTVNVTGITLTGDDAGNYTLASGTATTTADITARTLHVTATAHNKVYDGLKTATVSFGDDRVTDDFIVISGSANFGTKDVANNKPVNVTGITLAGDDAGNYQLASSNIAATADITPRTLNITATGQDKIYDGSMAATVIYSDDRIANDFISVSATGQFANADAGNGKTIHITGLGLLGDDAGNYVIGNSPTQASADIARRALTLTGLKIEDGTIRFDADQFSVANLVSGDSVQLGGHADVASFAPGTYAGFTDNQLTVDNANYTATGGVHSATIQSLTPTLPAAPAADPVPLTSAITASQEAPDAPQANTFNAPLLPLRVENGGIRAPVGMQLEQISQAAGTRNP